MKRALRIVAAAAALLSGAAAASGGQGLPYSFSPDTSRTESLQRGARNYMNYCSGCHSLKYLRYNRLAQDLGIPEDLLKKNLMFTSDKTGDHIVSSMPAGSGDPSTPSLSETWFGRAPPDLTLETRYRGADWVYSYLMTFYLDPTKPTGVNNEVLPGAAMPHVLGDLQGWQVRHAAAADAHGGHAKPGFEIVEAGSLSASEYKEFVADLVNFMAYAAEPGKQRRIATGFKVMIYLVLFLGLAWLLKHEYWKDVH